MKINWKDPKFAGLTKRQIKDYMLAVSKGKPAKLPKPRPSKRVNKRIKKQEFLESMKAPKAAHQSSKKLFVPKIPITVPETTKRQATLQRASGAPTVYIDAAFPLKNRKEVSSPAGRIYGGAFHHQLDPGEDRTAPECGSDGCGQSDPADARQKTGLQVGGQFQGFPSR